MTENTLVLVRHGESMGNVWIEAYRNDATNFCTIRGVKQAELAGLDLKRLNLQFRHVFSSSLTRARQTAVIIMQMMGDWERHYEIDTDLNEWVKPSHIKETFTDQNLVASGIWKAETEQEHHDRVKLALLNRILPTLEEGNTLCVSHWYTMRQMFKILVEPHKESYESFDEDKVKIENAKPYFYLRSNPRDIGVLSSYPEEQT